MFVTLALQTMLVAYPAPRERDLPDKGPGFVGVTFEPADEGGVLITDVRQDGPAEKAGLRVNDVIRKFHGESIAFDTFARKIIRIRPGTVVPLEVHRDGETVTLKIRIGLRPEDYPFPLPVHEEPSFPEQRVPPPK